MPRKAKVTVLDQVVLHNGTWVARGKDSTGQTIIMTSKDYVLWKKEIKPVKIRYVKPLSTSFGYSIRTIKEGSWLPTGKQMVDFMKSVWATRTLTITVIKRKVWPRKSRSLGKTNSKQRSKRMGSGRRPSGRSKSKTIRK